MSHRNPGDKPLPCMMARPDGVLVAEENLNRKVSGLKAKVLELGESIAHPLLHGDNPVVGDFSTSKRSTESEKCTQLLTSTQLFFLTELKELEQDFKLQVQAQKAENVRLKKMLMEIKSEKTAIHHQLLLLQRKVEKFENDIGRD